MRGRLGFPASALVGSLVLLCTPTATRAQGGPAGLDPVSRVASLAPGSIQGIVRDERGLPLGGAMVTAFGATSAFAVTDRAGRFDLPLLSPGPYIVRAHLSGFIASRGQMIEVRPSARASSAIALRHSAEPDAYPVATAGVVPASPDPPNPLTAPPGDDESPAYGGDDHGETAWRIRHARRSILKDAEAIVAQEESTPDTSVFAPVGFLGHAVGTPARAATSLFEAAPFSGQFNLLTTGSFDSPQQLFTLDSFSRGVAFASVGSPVGDSADWTASGAITQGDIASWIVAGSYSTRSPARHRYELGMSYAAQRYNGGSPVAVIGVTDGGRSAGALYGFDTYALTEALSLTYGARYARYDYLTDRSLISPRIGITIAPVGEHYRLSALFSHRTLAPGAEEFLPPSENGIWLPPERTFSSVSPDGQFHAERTDHVEVAVERDFGVSTLVLRAFHQQVADQLVTMFGVDGPGHPSGALGHYLVGNSGDVTAAGWTAGVRAAFADRVHGSVEYTQTTANWVVGSDAAYLLLVAPSVVRPGAERIHDISTAIETEVPETSTRLIVLYRLSNAFAQHDPRGEQPTFDARFDVQVRQALSFMNFSAARWEALFAVRNFFREAALDSSVYDELLVVRPPKRIVGGLTLRF